MMKWKTAAFAVLSVSMTAPAFASHHLVPAPGGAVAVDAEKTELDLAKIIALVRRRGWPADLGQMCPPSVVKMIGGACLAQQVAFFERDHKGRAFNVLPLRSRSVSYVVVLDLTGDVGIAYLASPVGKLISAATITAGGESKAISADEAQLGFQRQLQFWAANIEQFDKWLEKRKYGPVPDAQSTH